LIFIGLAIAVSCAAPIILFVPLGGDPNANPAPLGALMLLGTPFGLLLAGIGAAIALFGSKQRPAA